MTVSATTSETSYTGDNSTVNFPSVFVFKGTGAAAEITVIERTIATGAEVTKVYSTDYTVTGGAGSTGTVIASIAPADTVEWFIRRSTTQTQTSNYVTNDPFPADTLEGDIDRLSMVQQEQQADLEKAFTFPATYTGGASTSVPEPNANRVLAWNAGATALENGPVTVDITNAEANATAAAASAAAASTSETNAAASAASITLPLPVASGGTGGTSVATGQQGLDLEVGVDVQAYDADTAKTDVDQAFTAQQYYTPQSGGTSTAGAVTFAFAGATTYVEFTLTESLTDINFTGENPGAVIHLRFKQAAGSAYTITGWDTDITWQSSDTAPTMNTTLGGYTLVTVVCGNTTHLGFYQDAG